MDWFLRSWRPYLWLFLPACATYARTAGFGFSPLDDRWLIVGKLEELGSLAALPLAFTGTMFENLPYYRPLLSLSFVLDAMAGDGGPAAFHVTNILLHGLVSAILFRFFCALELTRPAAFAFSLLFAVHPVHVHAVAWIPGRNDLLLALFCLPASIYLIEYVASRKQTALVLHLLFLSLALLTKENAAVLPFVLLAYCMLVAKGSRRGVLIGGWAALLAAWLALRVVMVGDVSSPRQWNLPDVVVDAAAALVLYCGKLVVPLQQAIFPTVADSSLLPGAVVLLTGAVVVGLAGFVDRGRALFGAVWFLLLLAAPLVHGSSNGIGEHYEHRLYLPSVGFLLLVSRIDLARRLRSPRTRKALAVVPAALTVVFLVKALHRSDVYRTEASLARAGVAESPRLHLAYLIRGRILADEGDLDGAVADFRRALEEFPAGTELWAEAQFRLGAALSKQGASAAAIDHYRRALEVRADDANVRNNLANALARQGRLDEAMEQYAEALRIDPESAEVRNNLGDALSRQGRLEPATEQYREALRIRPGFAEAHNNLGAALARLGKPGEAVTHYREAVRLRPGFAEAHNNLGLALAQQGKLKEALREFSEVLRIQPDHAGARRNQTRARELLAQPG